jgi:DNA-binding SARP family transcriptional activator
VKGAVDAATRLMSITTDGAWLGIAQTMLVVLECSLDGRIPEAAERLSELATRQRLNGDTHFEGITFLNLAFAQRAMGNPTETLECATKAIDLLQSSSAGAEVASARCIRAWAHFHMREPEKARAELSLSLAETNETIRMDVLMEAADMEAFYGDESSATDHIAELRAMGKSADWALGVTMVTDAYVALRRGSEADAAEIVMRIDPDELTVSSGHKAHVLAVRAHAQIAMGGPDALEALELAKQQARHQSAGLWSGYCDALEAACGPPESLQLFVRQASRRGTWALTYVAELIVERLADLAEEERTIILDEARVRPDRWRPALRSCVDSGETSSLACARILEVVGEGEDVIRLRRLAHEYRGTPGADLGRGLVRRIAARVFVEDQGRVSIRVGSRFVDGSSIRRKVLALLCFLITRPSFAATRDEVMDALWPEFDPADALNSLNQTVYFLRRVFEPAYKEDLSPSYLHHESDLIWLDRELISSTSTVCLDIIKSMSAEPLPREVADLAQAYMGPFALDFAYEEWAADYRISLHSSYLQIIEKAVASDTINGHFERGIRLARRALDLTPDADQIELSLLRLYRLNGSHSAAAEQYTHYASAMRETLGVEPPALETL